MAHGPNQPPQSSEELPTPIQLELLESLSKRFFEGEILTAAWGQSWNSNLGPINVQRGLVLNYEDGNFTRPEIPPAESLADISENASGIFIRHSFSRMPISDPKSSLRIVFTDEGNIFAYSQPASYNEAWGLEFNPHDVPLATEQTGLLVEEYIKRLLSKIDGETEAELGMLAIKIQDSAELASEAHDMTEYPVLLAKKLVESLTIKMTSDEPDWVQFETTVPLDETTYLVLSSNPFTPTKEQPDSGSGEEPADEDDDEPIYEYETALIKEIGHVSVEEDDEGTAESYKLLGFYDDGSIEYSEQAATETDLIVLTKREATLKDVTAFLIYLQDNHPSLQ
jgi:hypothetical protein